MPRQSFSSASFSHLVVVVIGVLLHSSACILLSVCLESIYLSSRHILYLSFSI
ncbi:hypothetical protein CSUI_008789, partial [Cystoisospora suis]